MSKRRWHEPSTVAGRAEFRALRKQLARAGSKKERERLIALLDGRYPKLSGSPAEPPPEQSMLPAKSFVHANVPEGRNPVPVVPKPTDCEPEKKASPAPCDCGLRSLDYWLAIADKLEREKALREAREASDVTRALVLLQELPSHALCVLARESAPDARSAQWTMQSWLKREPFNRWDIRGSEKTVSEAVDDAYRLLAAKDAAEPGWFVKRAEERWSEESMKKASYKSPRSIETPAQPEPTILRRDAAPVVRKLDEPAESVVDTGASFSVNVILNGDPYLTRLAGLGASYDAKIRSAIAGHLQSHGFCDVAFLANLFNSLRPSSLAPRSF